MKKRLYGWKLLINYGYGHGWECELMEDSFQQIRERRKEYRENCPQYPTRIKYGYETIEVEGVPATERQQEGKKS